MMLRHSPLSNEPKEVLRHYLEDIIYGANDGIITTFTIISGVEGANLTTTIVIILGFVNLFADGISMGASRFLSIRAGSDVNLEPRGILEPLFHASCTFLSFLIFGLLPLAIFLIPQQGNKFIISGVITAFSLFLVGSLRGIVRKGRSLIAGIEMLCIGSLVALVAYFVGYLAKMII